MTLTSDKRESYPERYLKKDKRTKVYRALYGEPQRPDNGAPELNDSRRLPENFDYHHVKSIFETLAQTVLKQEDSTVVMVSNGLFSPQRYNMLLHRLDTLRSFKRR